MITVDVEKQVFADGLTVGNYTLLVNMCGWCEERFGDNWLYDWNDFYFKYEKDAVLFALKWL